MSLTVKHLNADATFLLTFRPLSPFPPSPGYSPGSFTILLDPWLSGPSNVYHEKFASSKLRVEPCISSLREIPEPDVVIISQDKPDHCNQETLQQLPSASSRTLIFGPPAAAKKVQGWKHFRPSQVHSLVKYDTRRTKRERLVRIPIPPISHFGSGGEVTIAFLPTRHDISGVHNAIGITYRPPTTSAPFWSAGHAFMPPSSPQSFVSSSTSSSSQGDRALSVIYAPHGVSYSTIEPYASSHLVSEAALPLTALLHSFDKVQNPWYWGGNVCTGGPGGLRIAQSLLAQCWISAHDEDKEVGGIATRSCHTRKFGRDEVQKMVTQGNGKRRTEVVILEVGQDLDLGAL
ncbi:MAG: hypothetical protein M1833_000983 [Piccolia ochrophora]|nr:MAG: hypothetical protein M1833_000983 [Piccolia ochrophora]